MTGPRILIVRVGAMGDVVHALPAVAMLRAAVPEAHIGWAIEPRWASLLRAEGTTARDAERMPLVDDVHLVEAKEWNRRPLSLATARSIAGLRSELRSARYNIAVDLQGTLRSAAIARMSRARVVVGSAAPREAVARFLYRTRVPLNATHVTDQTENLLSAALDSAGLSALRPAGPVAEESTGPLLPHDHAAEAWWSEQRTGLCGNRPFVVIAATAGWGAKEWPADKFAALAATLVLARYCVLLNTGPAGADAVTARVLSRVHEQHAGQAEHVHVLPATLPQLIAVARGATALIAGDSGPLHLAAALGVPVVGLFGPTAPERTGPRGRAIHLRHASSVTDHHRYVETEAGLERVTVEEVLAAFQSVTTPVEDESCLHTQ